jgi:hypothetical protein
MPWEALASRFVVSLAATSAAAVIYAWMLSWSLRNSQGGIKAAFTLLAYMLMVTVLGLSLVNIFLAQPDASIRQSLLYLGAVIILWACSVVPAVFYIGRYKLPELCEADYCPVQD